ncbi:hypothetical protein FH608_046145 [Nonomuraea phyllanthi]|uniref:Uncharacterized protein n=1 Tax=Nonomuraea phyllanthi TaxID=2219224 RepID=A0A5C4V6B0_9ACTN|nr:hypothetical protein [Nonomuraea phyllanthi]KAB8186877.1 hypothetical protein FH608_046145 [Nonomuraea phyllanthi]
MKLPVDALLEALTHPCFYLSGDENGGVGLHCRDHHDGGRPLAYYDRAGSICSDPEVANVATIPGLWAVAVDHLSTQHEG